MARVRRRSDSTWVSGGSARQTWPAMSKSGRRRHQAPGASSQEARGTKPATCSPTSTRSRPSSGRRLMASGASSTSIRHQTPRWPRSISGRATSRRKNRSTTRCSRSSAACTPTIGVRSTRRSRASRTRAHGVRKRCSSMPVTPMSACARICTCRRMPRPRFRRSYISRRADPSMCRAGSWGRATSIS